jgi:hypothetical protein
MRYSYLYSNLILTAITLSIRKSLPIGIIAIFVTHILNEILCYESFKIVVLWTLNHRY